MNSKQAHPTSSGKPAHLPEPDTERKSVDSEGEQAKTNGEHLHLPEPDPDNITVLTRNLPNKPILPWNRYDSPWRDEEEAESSEPSEVGEETEASHDVEEQNTEEVSDPIESQRAEASQSSEVVGEANRFEEEQSATAAEEQQSETPSDELEELRQLG